MAAIVYLAPGPFGAGGQFLSNTGAPLSGGLINTYAAGTTTPTATYTDKTGTVANANPIVAGSDGRIGEVWIPAGTAIDFALVDSTSNLIKNYAGLYGINDPATVNAIGVTGATISGALIMNLAPINEAQGANIPVAAAINLNGTTGNYLSLTGSGTITALQLQQGAYREFVVNSVSCAFQNSATLPMLGAASITPAVGDIVGFRGEASPVVRNVLYERASGAPLNISSITVSTANLGVILNTLTNALVADISLNTGVFTNIVGVTTGTVGLWLVTGSILLTDTTAGATFQVALNDGATNFASANVQIPSINTLVECSLNALIPNPSGGVVKFIAKDSSQLSGKVLFNSSGLTRDSSIIAVRLA